MIKMKQKEKFNKLINNHTGNTLVELLMYMTLMSILLVVLAQIFGMVAEYDLEYRSYSSSHTEGRFIVNKLTYDIKNADSITTPASVGNSGPSLTLVSQGTNNTYSLNNGILELDNGTTNYALNSDETNITYLLFTRVGNGGGNNSIKVEYMIESTILDNGIGKSKDFSSTIMLR